MEKLLRALFPTRLRLAGKILAVSVPLVTLLISWGLLWILYRIHPLLGFAVELLLASLTLAAKSLKTESMKVYAELQKGDLVQHASFGEGIIIDVKDGLATIAFAQRYGVRRIMADHPSLSRK